MSILLIWRKRKLQESPIRFLMTILGVAAVILLLVSTQTVYWATAEASRNDGDGLFRYLIPLLCGAALLCSGINLFLSYTGFLAGNYSQFRLLRTSGATEKQLFQCLFAEALVLDCIGVLLGCPLGFFVARSLMRAADPACALPSFFVDLLRTMRFALPEILLVPAIAMLAAALYFAPRRSNGEHRRKPRKNGRQKDSKRPGVFGAGGDLEHRFLHNDRRRRYVVLAALSAELTALLLLTGLFVELKHLSIRSDGGTEINVTYNANEKSDPMIETVDRVLSENRQNGRIKSMYSEHVYDGLRTFLLLDGSMVTDEYRQVVENADRSDEPFMWMFCACELGQNQQLAHCNMIFVDEDTFQTIAGENGIDCGAGEALLYNFSTSYLSSTGLRVPVLRQTPVSLSLYQKNAPLGSDGFRAVNTYYGKDFNAEQFLSEELPDCPKTEIRIAGSLEATQTLCDYDLDEETLPFLLFSQNDEAALAGFLSGVMVWNTALINTDDHAALSAELLDSIKELEGYDIRNHRFGVGTEVYGTARKNGGKGFYEQRDMAQMQKDFSSFQWQFHSFYVYFFMLCAVLMIINIVDISYLEQKLRLREYAVLYSLGLSEKQRTGMRLYESAFYSLRVALLGFFVSCVLFVPEYLFLMKGMLFESLRLPSVSLYDMNTKQTIGWILQKALHACGSAAVFSLIAAFVIFLMFASIGRYFQMRSNTDQLIPILKDETQ